MGEWIRNNEVFSGTAAAVLAAVLATIGWFAKKYVFKAEDKEQLPIVNVTNNNVQNNVIRHTASSTITRRDRSEVGILFVDDDTKFKVAKIMRDAGWTNVKILKDIKDLNAPVVKETDIFFLDIQGVGKSLGFADEGLGLALAVKKKYPQKKVVIYSAQTAGDRFHAALNKADGMLPKNADPYEFINLLEELSNE